MYLQNKLNILVVEITYAITRDERHNFIYLRQETKRFGDNYYNFKEKREKLVDIILGTDLQQTLCIKIYKKDFYNQ